MKEEEKKKKQQGRGGGRITQQAIHLFTKSYGSWKVQKHHGRFFNKAKNQFFGQPTLGRHFQQQMYAQDTNSKKENLSHAEIWNRQNNNSVNWFTGTKINKFLLFTKPKTNRTIPALQKLFLSWKGHHLKMCIYISWPKP